MTTRTCVYKDSKEKTCGKITPENSEFCDECSKMLKQAKKVFDSSVINPRHLKGNPFITYTKSIKKDMILTIGTVDLENVGSTASITKVKHLLTKCDLVVTHNNPFFIPIAVSLKKLSTPDDDFGGISTLCEGCAGLPVKDPSGQTFKQLCGDEETQCITHSQRDKVTEVLYQYPAAIAVFYNRKKLMAKQLKSNDGPEKKFHEVEKKDAQSAILFHFLGTRFTFGLFCANSGMMKVEEANENFIYVINSKKTKKEQCLQSSTDGCILSSTGTVVYNPNKMLLIPRSESDMCSLLFILE